MANNTRRNPHWLRNRVIYAVSGAIWILGVPMDLFFFVANKTTDDQAFLIIFVLTPFCVVSALFTLNTAAFSFAHGALGKFGRSTAPDESPVLTFRGSWGRIGQLKLGITWVSWYVYPTGLGLKIELLGSAFLPFQCIHTAEPRRVGLSRGVALSHNSPEIGSPVVVPSRVFAAIMQTKVSGNAPG